MLFLTRKIGESIMVGDDVCITIIQVSGRTVKMGIKYPKNIAVYREEIYHRIKQEKEKEDLSVQGEAFEL